MNELAKTESATPACADRQEYITPPVNIHQDAEGYTLEVEMPGVPKNGVDVTFEDGKLTLSGHRERLEDTFVYRESVDADFRRVFDLDPTIDSSRIEATVEQGLLTVRLPKAEAAKPRRITVG
jgi:HSP20 family protein